VQWDPTKDPTFDAPSYLTDDDDDDDDRVRDETWLTRRRRSSKPQQQQTTRPDSPLAPKSSKTDGPKEKLDLFQRTLDTLDYPIVLDALRGQCSTVPGRRMVTQASRATPAVDARKKIPSQFLPAYQPLTATSLEGIQERYGAVEEMQKLVDGGVDGDAQYRNRKGYKTPLGPPPFKGMAFDLDSILRENQVLEGPEILEIAAMLDTLQELSLWSEGLRQHEFVHLPKLAGCIQVNETLQELLHNAFDKEGRLSGATFSMVGQLRARVRTLKGDILNTLEALLASPSVSSKLALESGGPRFSEVNGRIVIPIDEKYNRAALGIMHDASRSGKTIFVEPTEIVGPTNELRQAEAELRAEEARVWRLLTEQILQNRAALEGSANAAGQLDLCMARVALGKELAGVIPHVGDEGIVSLRNAKHPVLLLRELDNVVGSNVDIGAGDNQGMVLTGPNSGGKTVILKLLGLVALMARDGIPVPASPETADYAPRVDFFAPVLADIGDIQSVGGDLSTFSGHMLVCREVLRNSGKNALILMDELGSGTDPRQGVAIAQALLEALLTTGARVAITTHYLELKQLAASDSRFSVAGMQFVNGRPTYKLLPGTVGESFALAVAERLELPPSVISRANELLDQETRQMGDLIRDLEDQKALVDRQAAEIAQKRREMKELEETMKKQQARLEQKQLSARRDEAAKFAKMLEQKEVILEEVLEKLRSDPSRKVVAKSWDEIKFVKRDVLNEAENVPSVVASKRQAAAKAEEMLSELVPLAELREKPDLNVGDKLMVCKKGSLFGKEATILQLGNRLEVQVSGMAVRLKMNELALPTANFRASPRPAKEGPKDRRKAADKLIQSELNSGGPERSSTLRDDATTSSSPLVTIRTDGNTVDVRGCNLEEASSMCKDKFSMSLTAGRPVVYILHGHGTSGILKTKIRNWLKSERTLVKRFSPADQSDGGDAFTRVELR
jgi:DNA mismatch repair protein MutS2